MKKLLLLTLLAAATIMTSCKKDDKTNGPALTLNKTEMTLTVSSTEQLTVTAPSEFAADPNMRWTSQNGSIASVNATGKVTAQSPGQVIIYGYVEGQNAVRGECLITVTAAQLALAKHAIIADAGAPVAIDFQYSSPMATSWDVKMSQSDTTGMKVLAVTTNPNATDADGKPVNYNPATGKGTFNVKGLTPGSVWLKVFNSSANPSGRSKGAAIDSVLITINAVAATSFDFAANCPDEVTLGDDSKKVLAEILPEQAAYRALYYKSLNTTILTVSAAGKITPVSVGAATILVSTDDGMIIRKTINVVEGVANEFGFTAPEFNVTAGGSKVKLTINTKPAGVDAIINVKVDNNGYKELPLSNISVAQSPADGEWYATAPYTIAGTGSAQVIATTTNSKGDKIADTCVVNVNAISPAQVLLKAAYYGDNLGTETIVTAYLNNYSSTPVTLKKVILSIDENPKPIETLEVNINVAAITGVGTVSFTKVPTLPAERKKYIVTYVFQADAAEYTLNQAVVLGNGASFVGKK